MYGQRASRVYLGMTSVHSSIKLNAFFNTEESESDWENCGPEVKCGTADLRNRFKNVSCL